MVLNLGNCVELAVKIHFVTLSLYEQTPQSARVCCTRVCVCACARTTVGFLSETHCIIKSLPLLFGIHPNWMSVSFDKSSQIK